MNPRLFAVIVSASYLTTVPAIVFYQEKKDRKIRDQYWTTFENYLTGLFDKYDIEKND